MLLVKAAPGDGLASDYGFTITDGDINMTEDDFTLKWIHASRIELQFTKIPGTPPLIFTPKTNVFSDSQGRIDADGGFIYELEADDFGCRTWMGFDYREADAGSAEDRRRAINAELPTSGGRARVEIQFRESSAGECTNYDNARIERDGNGLGFQDTNLSRAYFGWLGSGKISTTNGGKPGSFTESSPGSDIFWRDEEGPGTTCRDKLIVDRAANTVRWFELKDGSFSHNKTPPDDAQAPDCGMNNDSRPTSDVAWPLVGTEEAPSENIVDPGAEGGGNATPDCYTGLKSSLAWIMCPILGAIDNFIEWAERAIKGQLTVDLGSPEARASLQEAWRIIARLASGVLVSIALVMVIATALGSDMISPYALKKVLPRLVIGAIGIWLSWALVSTYIDIMNDLGNGIASIMLSPFQEAKEFSLQNMAGIASGDGQVATSGTLFVGLATAGIFSAGIFGILGAGLTALFAFLVAIVVLALRQAVIIFLIILAPLGFAMWILPNTQKMWKLWSGTLNKLLIMFPMIMGLLTAGKIFSYITAKSITNDESTIDHFLAFSISLIAYVAPYFFLPALFKAAGGAFSSLTGMVNNTGKGFFDKAKGGLDAKAKARKTFKDQMGSEKLARKAAGEGPWSSIARSRMRARGGQPITGGVLSIRNRAATKQRIGSSMDAAQAKLEAQQIEEETARLSRAGTLGNKADLRAIALDEHASIVQRKAAINGLANMRDDGGVRLAKESMSRSTNSAVNKAWNQLQSSKELGEAFKDSAPDILREGAFSGGISTALMTKASKGTFEQATAEYQGVHDLISGLHAGTISPASLNAKQQSLARAYLSDASGKVDLSAAGLVEGEKNLKKAILTTVASAKLAVTNETLRADFKAPQATETYKMLATLEGTPAAPGVFAGLATTDIAAALAAIDPISGLK